MDENQSQTKSFTALNTWLVKIKNHLNSKLHKYAVHTQQMNKRTSKVYVRTLVTDAGTFVLVTAEHLATDHCTRGTLAITTLTKKQLHTPLSRNNKQL